MLLITKADVGGAQVHVLEIIKRLQNQYEFVLACGEEDYLTHKAQTLGVEVHILEHLKRPISLLTDYRAIGECLDLLRKLKPDLLHCHSSKAGVIGRIAAWKTKTPSLFTAHGWSFTEGAPWLQRSYGLILESILCRLIGQVVTVSNYDFRLAQRYRVGSDQRRHLILNGVSQATLQAKLRAVPVLKIVSVGRLSQVKNHALMLKALAALRVPYQAFIIGEGDCRGGLENAISSLGLQNRVTLLGEVTDTATHLTDADIFVLSSNYEGLPLSILEAMSMGLSVVSTDVGGVSEAVLHQKTGLLSPPKDANALAKNITRLAENEQLRAQYGKAALAHYKKNFTAPEMVQKLSLVYQNLID